MSAIPLVSDATRIWTTQDGYVLHIKPGLLYRVAARHRIWGLSGLVRRNYRGLLTDAVRRTLREIVESSRRVSTDPGARSSRFATTLSGHRYVLYGRPLGGGHHEVAVIRKSRPLLRTTLPESEPETGPGAAGLHQALFDWLLRMGLLDGGDPVNRNVPLNRVVRWGQAQVKGVHGATTARNKPDISYVDARGRRVNVEIDKDPNQSRKHEQRNIAFDPSAHHIFLLVNRAGKVLNRREYRPGQGGSQVARPGSASTRIPLPWIARLGRLAAHARRH